MQKSLLTSFFTLRASRLRLSAKAKKGSLLGGAIFLSLLLLTPPAEAALFSQLTQSGSEIFEGMKDIIYAVAGFGIVGIAIGAFFGNLNWKWLSAIIIGLMVIAGTAGILSAYRTGKGRLKLRARAEIQTTPNGREEIVITEIPYQVNKSKMIKQIEMYFSQVILERIEIGHLLKIIKTV